MSSVNPVCFTSVCTYRCGSRLKDVRYLLLEISALFTPDDSRAMSASRIVLRPVKVAATAPRSNGGFPLSLRLTRRQPSVPPAFTRSRRMPEARGISSMLRSAPLFPAHVSEHASVTESRVSRLTISGDPPLRSFHRRGIVSRDIPQFLLL